ncbi:hypothetical protein [Polyangium sp. 15x6]|uniref:hypothetical protein n=1 Tax=Polyangium sp. 15x6 TaxID=3042687 RepID=UPI00249B6B71|nr:hypothetical protein [Polyangium sp. 15x6]MDI3288661.1 hypothetical protein [Polyangium sp. 15x6]
MSVRRIDIPLRHLVTLPDERDRARTAKLVRKVTGSRSGKAPPQATKPYAA